MKIKFILDRQMSNKLTIIIFKAKFQKNIFFKKKNNIINNDIQNNLKMKTNKNFNKYNNKSKRVNKNYNKPNQIVNIKMNN